VIARIDRPIDYGTNSQCSSTLIDQPIAHLSPIMRTANKILHFVTLLRNWVK